jgi:hypothetical protein
MIVLLSSNCVYNKDNHAKIILAIIEHKIQTSNQAYYFIQFLLVVIDFINL